MLNAAQKITNYSTLIDNELSFNAIMYCLSFFNYYQLKNLELKISNTIPLSEENQSKNYNNQTSNYNHGNQTTNVISNSNAAQNQSNNSNKRYKCKYILNSNEQKKKLLDLISYVIKKINKENNGLDQFMLDDKSKTKKEKSRKNNSN